MKIAILAPIETSSVAGLLPADDIAQPNGYPGAPLFGVLIRTLISRGHEVEAFTTDKSLLGAWPAGITRRGSSLAVHYIPSRPRAFRLEGGRLGRMLDFFSLERRALIEKVSSFNPDVIHAHWVYEFAWAALDSGYPTVVTSHDSPRDVLAHSLDPYRAGRYLMARHVLKRAKYLTAVSPLISQRLSSMTDTGISIVPNPISDTYFSETTAKNYRNAKPKRLVTIINGWSKLKNPEPALAAFAQLKREWPDLELHCFGADFGPGEKAYEWMKRHGTLEGVHFRGRCPHEDVLEELATADVLVHPSRTEACSMAIAEAMSLGVPVVGGRASGGVPWQLDYGNAGCLVDIESASAIAAGVRTCLESASARELLGESSRRRAKALFSAKSVVSAYEEKYLEAYEDRRS